MTERTRRRLAWTIWIVGLVVMVGAIVAFHAARAVPAGNPFPAPGVRRDRGRRSDRGAASAEEPDRVDLPRSVGRRRGRLRSPARVRVLGRDVAPDRPRRPIAVWLGNWTWVPIFTLLLTYPFLLFPDGHLPSPRWRPVAWGIAIASVLWSASFALNGGSDYTNPQNEHVRNPFAPASLVATADVVRFAVSFVMIGFIAATVASLVIRYRRFSGDERGADSLADARGRRDGLLVRSSSQPWLGWVGRLLPGPRVLSLMVRDRDRSVAILKYRLYERRPRDP